MLLKLPPLNALKAFEIAARSGSYVAAANELRVSPAAVSQQVRKLEQYFDKKLFVRYNNRIVLTDAGTTIYTNAAPALAGTFQRNPTSAGRFGPIAPGGQCPAFAGAGLASPPASVILSNDARNWNRDPHRR